MGFNFKNAFNLANKIVGSDAIKQAQEIAKGVNSPQDAFKALSQFGDPQQIISNGMSKLNNPLVKNMAKGLGASDADMAKLDGLMNDIRNSRTQNYQNNNMQDNFINREPIQNQNSHQSILNRFKNRIK